MPLSSDQACSIARRILSCYKKAIGQKHDTPIQEFFNEAFVSAIVCKNEQLGYVSARYRVCKLLFGDTHKEIGRQAGERGEDRRDKHIHLSQNEHLALHLDLLFALSQLSEQDRLLLCLRSSDGLTQAEAAVILGIPYSTLRVREAKLLGHVQFLLRSWRMDK